MWPAWVLEPDDPKRRFQMHLWDEPSTINVKTVYFRCSRVVWQFKPLICFPAAKQGIILQQEAEKAFSWMRLVSESHWCHLFSWWAEFLLLGLEFGNFKPWIEIGIFKCISWLNGSVFFFWAWWLGFSEREREREREREYRIIEWQECRLLTRQLFFFFLVCICCLWSRPI